LQNRSTDFRFVDVWSCPRIKVEPLFDSAVFKLLNSCTLSPERMIKTNTKGLLTGESHSGTFGNVFPFMLRSHFWLPFGTLLIFFAHAQANTAESGFEFGRPMFRYFTMRDFGASEQSRVAIQDAQGRMLFENRDSVLE
jgi:hypothetical protein